MSLDLDEKYSERIEQTQFTATSPAANVWSTDISEHIVRKVVGILICGLASADAVTLKKVKEDDTTIEFIDSARVKANENEMIGWNDWKRPLLVLEGGTNLQAVRDGSVDVELTVFYIDSEVHG